MWCMSFTTPVRALDPVRVLDHTGFLDAVEPPPAIEVHGRNLTTSRADVVDGCVILPGGFACAVPEAGRIVTVPMDRGWLVHVEAVGDDVLVAVEPPPGLPAPADDATLARLAIESRSNADDAPRALERAWAYRRACERLVEPFPADGGPVVPVRWTTLSYEDRVHVPGVGTLDVKDGDAAYLAADGRRVLVRRASAPSGAVEVIVCPPRRPSRITTSPRAVPLDWP
jgi:hypothetical protein